MDNALPVQWRRAPPPDRAVTKLSSAVDEASREGQVRVLAVVTLNPMLRVEFDFAGELDEVRKNLLIGALQRLIRKIDQEQ